MQDTWDNGLKSRTVPQHSWQVCIHFQQTTWFYSWKGDKQDAVNKHFHIFSRYRCTRQRIMYCFARVPVSSDTWHICLWESTNNNYYNIQQQHQQQQNNLLQDPTQNNIVNIFLLWAAVLPECSPWPTCLLQCRKSWLQIVALVHDTIWILRRNCGDDLSLVACVRLILNKRIKNHKFIWHRL